MLKPSTIQITFCDKTINSCLWMRKILTVEGSGSKEMKNKEAERKKQGNSIIMTHWNRSIQRCHSSYILWRMSGTSRYQSLANIYTSIKHRNLLWGSDTHFVVWEGVNSNKERPDMFRKVCNPSVVWRRTLQ